MREMQATLYTAADFYLLRAPALSALVFSQLTALDADGDTAEEDERRLAQARTRYHDLLLSLVKQPQIRLALSAASRDIFEGIARIQHGESSQRAERAYSRLLRYLIRMSTRPTPFGLFAGVAVGTFANCTTAELATPPIRRIRTRPDMDWLLTLIQRIEQTKDLLPHLHLMTNQTIYLPADHLAYYIAGSPATRPLASVHGQPDSRTLNLQAMPAVHSVLEQAQYPIPYTTLRANLLKRLAKATPERVDRLLQLLWDNHLLISNLRPSMIGADPAHTLLEQLATLPGLEPECTALKAVLTQSSELDRAGVAGSTEQVQQLLCSQKQLVPEGKGLPFQIDCLLDLKSDHLHKSVALTAAQAAETLLKISRHPRGLPHLQAFRQAFVERYGLGAEVPLLDLLSSESGFGIPSGYKQPPPASRPANPSPPPDHHACDAILCELVTQAINERSMEVELTPSLLEQLAQWSPLKDGPPPATIEIALQIQAASREALDRGEWSAVAIPKSQSGGGCTFSRFFDVLETNHLRMLQDFTRREEVLFPDVIFAELSYLPSRLHSANAAVRPPLYSYEIVVNTTPSVPPEKVIYLRDLVVGVRDNRFYIRSLRLGKEIVVRQSHMLHPKMAPNICRFLIEVAQDNCPAITPFDWGAASTLPFLPRVVQGRVVLSPAQWNVRASAIEPSGSGSAEVHWLNGLRRWRKQWRVPRYVYLTEGDNRLLLDLEHPFMAAELRNELKKVGASDLVTLQEVFPDFDHLWLRDRQHAPYFAEIVVPLVLRDLPRVPASSTQAGGCFPSRTVSRSERQIYPGSAWTYLKCYAGFRQHDALLAGPVREIVHALQERAMIDRWFFVRYADPEPHLRLRFHAASAEHSQAVLTTVLAWAHQQAEQGRCNRVSIDTYEREVERYGGPRAIEILEEVFTIDSAILSKVIAARHTQQLTLDPLAIAVFSLDQFFLAWGLAMPERLRWLENWPAANKAPKEFYSQRKFFCELLAGGKQNPDPTVATQRAQLHALLAAQDQPLRALATQLRQLALHGELWGSEEHILGSLAHMHLNRLMATDQEQESKVYRFWRSTLESILRRPTKTT